ncbi:hypothetical protein ACLK2E_07110 [Escherichia coli]
MSSTLRAASKDTPQVKDKTWHYYSLPLAAKQLGDLSRCPNRSKCYWKTCCAGRTAIP